MENRSPLSNRYTEFESARSLGKSLSLNHMQAGRRRPKFEISAVFPWDNPNQEPYPDLGRNELRFGGSGPSRRAVPKPRITGHQLYPLLLSFFSTKVTTFLTEPKLSVVTSSSSIEMVKRS